MHLYTPSSFPSLTSNFPSPVSPDLMDWTKFYPQVYQDCKDKNVPVPLVDMADVGCGYGGLLVALSKAFPDNLIIGMEIRTKVVQYVEQRIKELRETHQGSYNNISVLETNAMKFLPNFFAKGQLQKLFFLFPDPHFKKANHRRRIISPTLLAEYAYILAIGGKIYTVTDVKDLYDWEVKHLDEHPLFERVPDEEAEKDPVVPLILTSTEESKKVERQKGDRFYAVYRRIENKVQN